MVEVPLALLGHALILDVILVLPKLAFKTFHSNPFAYSVKPLLNLAGKLYSHGLLATSSAKLGSGTPDALPILCQHSVMSTAVFV